MPSRNRRHDCLAMLAVLILTAAVFAPAMRYGFLANWDDGIFIVENGHLELTAENFRLYGLKHYRNLYTPLPMYSLMADHALFGLDPAGYHIHNLLLHLGGAFFFFLILRKLGIPTAAALLGTLLWALNPQKNESVVWITERKDVQMGLFAFAAFWCFLCAGESATTGKAAAWDTACALLTIAAIFAKPAATPLCGVYPAWLLLHPDWRRRWRSSALIPVTAGLAATIWAGYMTAQDNPGSMESNPAIWLHNLLWYPATAFWPLHNPNPIYPAVGPLREHLALLFSVPLLVLALLWHARHRRHCHPATILRAALILGGTLLPVLGLWHYTSFEYCDRYNYLVSAAAIAAVLPLFPQRPAALATGALLVAVMGLFTCRALPQWQSDTTVWQACLFRSGRLNPKAIEVAASDAFHRQDSAALATIADRLSRDSSLLNQRHRQGENTVLLLRSYAAFLQQRELDAAAFLAPLCAAEREKGRVRFLRGANYRIVYGYLKDELRFRTAPPLSAGKPPVPPEGANH